MVWELWWVEFADWLRGFAPVSELVEWFKGLAAGSELVEWLRGLAAWGLGVIVFEVEDAADELLL